MNKIDSPNCPQCGSKMLEKTRKWDGQKFWGCPLYFKTGCRGAREMEPEKTIAQIEKEVELSIYQENFITEICTKDGGNIVLIAVAGSGKTFIIVYALRYTHGDVIFLAFNKAIAETIKRKAPKGKVCSTLHSLGNSALSNYLHYQPRLEDKKKMGIAKEFFPDDEDGVLRSGLVNLASKCQNTLTDPNDQSAILGLIDRYNIDFSNGENGNGNEARAIEALPILLKECMTRTRVVDFDDMVWLPIVLNIPIPKYDWVLVDEGQDLNKANTELILRARKPDGRIVIVGDPAQSIYGFRGADTNAIPSLIERLNAKEMPLSITYRCPRSHVELAQQLVPHLEAAPWAEPGEIVENLPRDNAVSIMVDGDLVMCRTNAPLVKLCYQLIRAKKKATIQGRDIGQGLLQLIDKLKPKDLDNLLEKLEAYRWREMTKLQRMGRENSIQSLEDKCECIIALCEDLENLSELRASIENIFTDKVTGIILSSVHRAKGLEADTTFILKPELMPFPKATKLEDMKQELNILYVALTRAKKSMVFIEGFAPIINPETYLSGSNR